MAVRFRRIRLLLRHLRILVEERPLAAIFLLWALSLPVAAVASLQLALHLKSEDIAAAVKNTSYNLDQRVQRVAEMTQYKFYTIRKFVDLLSTDSRLVAALQGSGNIAECNAYLKSVGETLSLHRAFLLNRKGRCVATSDAGMPKNLLGVSMADREYFTRAMDGEIATQFVVGRVSTVPGFHFSAPVRGAHGNIGVVVLKVDTSVLAQQLYLPTGFVTDSAGVVVLSDNPENMLRAVPGGSAATLDKKQSFLRYLRDRLDNVYMRKVQVVGHEAWQLRPQGPAFLCRTVSISKEGLSVYGFATLVPLLSSANAGFRLHLGMAFIFCSLGLAVAIGMFVHILRDRYLRRALQRLNETLTVQAQRDALTGLLNRRMFDELAEDWFARTRRQGAPFALVLFDIDLFKHLNDSFGHQAGDHILRDTAQCVRKLLLRRSDRVFRIGGEEFAVLPQAETENHVRALMEMLRSGVEGLRMRHPMTPNAVVTISLGGCLWAAALQYRLPKPFGWRTRRCMRPRRKGATALYWRKTPARKRSAPRTAFRRSKRHGRPTEWLLQRLMEERGLRARGCA